LPFTLRAAIFEHLNIMDIQEVHYFENQVIKLVE
jgi:hypothetical protein